MNTRKRNLLIVGSANCAREDVAGVPPHFGDVMLVGMDAVDKFPGSRRVDYVVTNHPEDIAEAHRRRNAICGNTDYRVVSWHRAPGVDIVESHPLPSGSSALTGALAGLRLGYERIILAGCPLTGNAPEGNPYEAFRPGWIARQNEIAGRVRSMSGWTRECLGEPPWWWLEPRITIIACWDGGDYYPPEYVNRLYRACLRNTTVPFDFVLLCGPEASRPGRLDAIDPAIHPVPTELTSWWCGMPAWMERPPGSCTDTILYLDLDQVVVGSLDDIIYFPSDHAMMKDYPARICPSGKEGDGCVSTSLIRRGAGRRVWEIYEAAGKPVWDAIRGPAGKLPMAAQGIVNDPANGIPHDLFPEAWVCSYKLEVLRTGSIPEDCRTIAFHGRPKMHEVADREPWIREHWR
jgi:hypothetical protein